MSHRNPWTPGRNWQVFSTDLGHTIDDFPTTTAVCSHRNRNTATACSWLRDALTVAANTKGATPRLSYSIRRTPAAAHRRNEENGIPCVTPDHHYCPRLGTWLEHDPARS